MVTMPARLMADRTIRPQAKLLYALLQTLPGRFTHGDLARQAGISTVTTRHSIRDLLQAGWIRTTQASKQSPIRFSLLNPDRDRITTEIAHMEVRLQEAEYKGELIMKEYLSLLVDSDDYEDNARPGFLVNPLTGELMELDRYYSGLVGFEYNGEQHERPTKRFPDPAKVAMQQARDLMKEALCARRGIKVVVITAADLSLKRMLAKVGNLLPLRDPNPNAALFQYLDRVSRSSQKRP